MMHYSPISALVILVSTTTIRAFGSNKLLTRRPYGVVDSPFLRSGSHRFRQAVGNFDSRDDVPKGNGKPLTAADILARARKSIGGPAVGGEVMTEDVMIPFDEETLDDMQACLLTLEKRVKEGPGSLSANEVLNFDNAMTRIVEDMHIKVKHPPSRQSHVTAVAASPVSEEPLVSQQPPPSTTFVQNNDEEGPLYDGKGGLGMARGTRSTYVIPGMEEMSPEEYRAALQKSVTDRQTKRKSSTGGVVGNRAALQYLDQLGYGGASNNWQSKSTAPAGTAALGSPTYTTSVPPPPRQKEDATRNDTNPFESTPTLQTTLEQSKTNNRMPIEYRQPSHLEAQQIVDRTMQQPNSDTPVTD